MHEYWYGETGASDSSRFVVFESVSRGRAMIPSTVQYIALSQREYSVVRIHLSSQ